MTREQRLDGEGILRVRTLARVGVTAAALVALAYFIASMSAKTAVVAFDEPIPSGQTFVQFALGMAIVLGWSVLSGVEAAWRDDGESTAAWWEPFVFAALPRFIGGIVLLFVIVGIEFGLEALGVGLGASG